MSAAVRLFNADKKKYLHYLIEEIPPAYGHVTPEDFHLPRLRYREPSLYLESEFRRSKEWMESWGLIDDRSSYEDLVECRISLG
jgi:NitT/TauT family transport system substrate-binding protein